MRTDSTEGLLVPVFELVSMSILINAAKLLLVKK